MELDVPQSVLEQPRVKQKSRSGAKLTDEPSQRSVRSTSSYSRGGRLTAHATGNISGGTGCSGTPSMFTYRQRGE